jgi:hypothetical protein
MNRPVFLALVTLAASAGIIEVANAWDGHDRRQDRRQAIVAGSIREDIANSRAEDRYRECMRESSYDEDCARQRYRDEQDAHRKGRRTAIIVGEIN